MVLRQNRSPLTMMPFANHMGHFQAAIDIFNVALCFAKKPDRTQRPEAPL